MYCYADKQCPHTLKDKLSYFLVPLLILSLAFSSFAVAQKQAVSLDVTQYPELIYKTQRIPITRDLFNSDSNLVANRSEDKDISTFNKGSYGPLICNEWSQKIKYLGVFKAKGETWILVQNSKLLIDKVRKGDSITHSELVITAISENSFIASVGDSSECSFQKINY
jgi:hypothetical protein